ERHVDRLLEGECLDRDERLVVIHGHDDIIFSTSDRAEERVGCVRSADRNPGGAGGFDPSTNLLLFVPKPPALPGVRIERGGRQAWRCPINALVLASGEARQGGDVVRL